MNTDNRRYWHGRTWRIAAPVIITNISVPLLGAVDTAVVGRLPGPEYLGAVAIGAMIMSLLYNGCNFLRMGTTGLTAQSFGAGDGNEVRNWMARALLIAGALGLLFIALQWPVYAGARIVLAPSDAVDPLTQTYFAIRVWGAPAALANFVLLGWFFGVQDVRAALITQIYMNGINMVLDIWFVLGLGWGVDGVAWATVIAEYTALGLGLILVIRRLSLFGGRFQKAEIFDAAALKRMFRVNRDIFLRSMCLKAMFIAITAIGSRMGDNVLAANAILLQIQAFVAYALDGFATAAEALTGEAKGAKRRKDFDDAVRSSTQWAGGFAAVLCVAIWVTGVPIIDLLTTVESVRQTAYQYLPWSIVLPAVAVWSFQLDGIFIGCTWSREMRNAMAMSLMLFLVALLVFVPAFDNHGLWAAFLVSMMARALTMAWLFRGLRSEIGETA